MDEIMQAIVAEIEDVLETSGYYPYRFDRKRGIVTLQYPYHVDEMLVVESIMDACRRCNVELRLKPKM